MTPDFCTYFDAGYLPRALALYESLQQYAPKSRLFVVCMDFESFDTVVQLDLPGLVAVSRTEFEANDAELASLAASRTVVEYYFTCTSSVILYVLNKSPEIEALFYVDADMWFFSPINELLQDMAERSVYIVEHRFPGDQKHLEVYGRFNVGILGFRNNLVAKDCLLKWRQDCIEWCFDRLEGDRFADQKYLDQWPGQCDDLRIATHQGINVAPWNKANYVFSKTSEGVLVNGCRLICFHFQGLRVYRFGLIEPQSIDYGSAIPDECLEFVYKPYLRSLTRISRTVHQKSTSRRYGREPSVYEIWQTRRQAPYLLQFSGCIFRLFRWRLIPGAFWLQTRSLLAAFYQKMAPVVARQKNER
jgi:hypothetical protein